MKKNYLLPVILFSLAACSTDREELDEIPVEKEVSAMETIEEFIAKNNELTFITGKSADGYNEINKAAYSSQDLGIIRDKNTFVTDCSNLVVVDFESIEVGSFNSPLDNNTENSYVAPGDIPEGIVLSTLHSPDQAGDLILMSFTTKRLFHRFRLYEPDPNATISLVVDFTTEVKKVGLDIVGLMGGSGGVTVDFYGETGILSTELVFLSGTTFVGFTSLEAIKKVIIYQEESIGFIGLDNIYFGEFCDTDQDGCTDEKDSIINSNMEETINIRGCDSTVINKSTSTCGVMMADAIDALENRAYSDPYTFRSEVMALTSVWASEGLITTVERNSILGCIAAAGPSYIPSPWWPVWPCWRSGLGRRCR